jgi:hypothetical protein
MVKFKAPTVPQHIDLRDHFAGLAMAAIVSGVMSRECADYSESAVAHNAYQMADWMLQTRAEAGADEPNGGAND